MGQNLLVGIVGGILSQLFSDLQVLDVDLALEQSSLETLEMLLNLRQPRVLRLVGHDDVDDGSPGICRQLAPVPSDNVETLKLQGILDGAEEIEPEAVSASCWAE